MNEAEAVFAFHCANVRARCRERDRGFKPRRERPSRVDMDRPVLRMYAPAKPRKPFDPFPPGYYGKKRVLTDRPTDRKRWRSP